MSLAKYRQHPEALKHPLSHQLFLGGVSSSLSILVTNPIDVIKCRLQLQQASSHRYQGMLRGGRQMVQEEGLMVLYKGLGPALWRSATYSAVCFGLYENLRDDLFGKFMSQQSFSAKVLAGVTSGSIAAAVGNPFELIKVRMQAKDSKHRSTLMSLKEICQTEGVLGLWKGLWPAMGRAALLTASQMSIYDQTKGLIKKFVFKSDGETVLLHFLSAMAAGVVTTTVTSPFDVVKTLIMQNPVQYDGGKMSVCFQRVLKEEGIRGLFKGWVPNYVRLGPQTVITFLVYEEMRRLLGWNAL